MRPSTKTATRPEPTREDLDRFVRQLEASWTATVTVRRQSKDDVGLRQIYVSLDDERMGVLLAGQEVTRDVQPGRHILRVHNTLFWRRIVFTLEPGEHACFTTVNRAGFLTFSPLAFFLGTNVLYLRLHRDSDGPAGESEAPLAG